MIPVNAFLIRADEPVLVDTGILSESDAFMEALESVIDLDDIRWVWLTHTDPDHIGSLARILGQAPEARVVTTFLGMGKMILSGLPPDRAYLVNPGQSLDVGDRELRAFRPPTFDAPESTGFFDTETKNLFSVDSFGAAVNAPAQNAADIPPEDLREGLIAWTSLDVPWLNQVPADRLNQALNTVRDFEPRTILSSHLPPAEGMMDALIDNVLAAREVPPFVGPDQAEMMKMMEDMAGPGAPGAGVPG
jgi:flavorubredoxin